MFFFLFPPFFGFCLVSLFLLRFSFFLSIFCLVFFFHLHFVFLSSLLCFFHSIFSYMSKIFF